MGQFSLSLGVPPIMYMRGGHDFDCHSELIGAEWEYFSRETAIYRVEWQLIDDERCHPKGWKRKPRPLVEVLLSKPTVDALEDYRRREALRGLTEAPTKGLIFCKPSGKALSRHAESSQFAALVKEAKLLRRTPHDIRHTTATLMLMEGANILQVQHQLRHSTASVTLDKYGHLLPQDRRSGFGTNDGLTPPTLSQTGTDG